MFVTEPSSIPADQLAEALATQAARVDAELSRLLALAAECERRLPRADESTFAGWLAWRCSLSARQAREHERIGKRLGELPLIHDAFSRGELSYAKVSALTRVAKPESEAELVRLADVLTAPQLERALAAYRRVGREEAAGQQEREFLSYQWGDDGSLGLRARLAGEDGALVLRALEAGREALWQRRPVAPPHAGQEQKRPTNAEALVAAAELALASAGERSGAERYQLVLHVDADTLARDADGRCELADGTPLAAETARRLACDSSVVELHEHAGVALALGRKRRTISPALRRALQARDRRCRFPGCDNTRFLDGHHVRHWSQGGETNIDNLLLLCRRHHRLVHEHGCTIERDHSGRPHFTNAHGVRLDNVPRPPPPIDPELLRRRHRELHIDSDTCRNGDGDRMDLALTVDAISAAVAA